MLRAWLSAVVASAAILVPLGHARADDKRECVAASEKAQQLRNAGKLIEARDQLAICGRAECPKIVQGDCTQWMADVLNALPTVIPAAKDRTGKDIVDVHLTVDGKPMTDTLDGRAVAVDPGVHTFHFETKGAPAIEQQIVVRQSEKNRILPVTFAIGDDATTKPPEQHEVRSPPAEETSSGPPIVGFALAGAGLVGGGIAAYLGLSADSDARNLRDTCAPKCTQSQVDDVQSHQQTAVIVAIASGVVFAAGVALIVIHYATKSGKSGSLPTLPEAVIRF
ncbi:MAG TPA: hypothetical protein VIF62_04525 [Labilithrix sp.]|jgi:hypothetical protein